MESEVVVPMGGQKVTLQSGKLNVPHNSIISFIEGDGTGVDVTPVMLKVVDIVVEKAYKDERKISWMEVYTGEESTQVYGQDVWLPAETLDLVRNHRVAIKDPLTTLVGGGIHSLNVALRQEPDLYVCLCPVRYYRDTPSPIRHPELTNMVIFREDSEDIYAGIEWRAGSAGADRVIKFLRDEMGVKKICFPEHCGTGIKPCPEEGTKRLVRAAIEYAITNGRDSLTLVHKDNIIKFTEGAFKDWGYQPTREGFGGELIDGSPWVKIKNPNTGEEIVVKDMITDAFLQQILLRPAEYNVIACMNLNGDYISDALAAQIGGIGIVSSVGIDDECVLFEAAHGTAPKYAGQDRVNPGSIILSAEMMLHHMQWLEVVDPIIKGMGGTITAKTVTYGLERLVKGAKLLKCPESGDAIIVNM